MTVGDPAWFDDERLLVPSSSGRDSIAFHAATERAEGRAPAAAPPAPSQPKPSRRRKAASNQASFFPDQETAT